MMIDTEEQEAMKDVLAFLEKSKANFYKNIVYAFQNHIIYNCPESQKRKYEDCTEEEWSFEHIKLRIYQNLRNCGRFGLKIRNLLQSENLSGVFIHFLRNIDELWLNDSKIKDKDSYKQQINMILEAYEKKILIQNISYYKKVKK